LLRRLFEARLSLQAFDGSVDTAESWEMTREEFVHEWVQSADAKTAKLGQLRVWQRDGRLPGPPTERD
jgi:hypothetical protein